MNIKNIFKRWKEIKSLVNSNEYFLATANFKNISSNSEIHNPIIYEYMNNSDRDMFYVFIHDYIEKNIRPNTGMFECILEYSYNDVYAHKGDIVYVTNGFAYLSSTTGKSYPTKISQSELYAHFAYIG